MKREDAAILSVALTATLFCFIIVHVFRHADAYDLASGICVFLIAAIILTSIARSKWSINERILILAGLFARILCVLLSFVPEGGISDFLYSGDQPFFVSVAESIWNGVYIDYTRFPDFMNGVYHLYGPNRIVIHVMNILAWYLGCEVLARVKEGYRTRNFEYFLGFYCLLPQNILLTAGVFRESIMSLSLMCSYYKLNKWMIIGHRKDILLSFLALIPALWLHSGNVIIAVSILMVSCFWSRRDYSWKPVTVKKIAFPLAIAAFIILYNAFLSKLFYIYLPSKITLQSFASKVFDVGRTNYISNDGLVIDNIFIFIAQSLYRIFYFWASPTPKYWGTVMDIVGFVFDTIPWLFVLCLIIRKVIKNTCDASFKAIFIIMAAYTFIYAWGTGNSGTAMRHRDQMTGIVTLAFFIEARLKERNPDQYRIEKISDE